MKILSAKTEKGNVLLLGSDDFKFISFIRQDVTRWTLIEFNENNSPVFHLQELEAAEWEIVDLIQTMYTYWRVIACSLDGVRITDGEVAE